MLHATSTDLPNLFDGHHYAAKWGISDFYDDAEASLVAALAAGTPFRARWGAKKEIVFADVEWDGSAMRVGVSVSNDFDHNVREEDTIDHLPTLEELKAKLDALWDAAGERQKDESPVVLFQILAPTKGYGMYSGGEPQGKATIRPSWIETVALPADGDDDGTPPGDYYYQWGFQCDGGRKHFRATKAQRQQMLEWCWANLGTEGEASLTVGRYTVKKCRD